MNAQWEFNLNGQGNGIQTIYSTASGYYSTAMGSGTTASGYDSTELVSESNGVKSVNYQGLVPVLINALKEQQTEIDTYRDEVSELKEMVQALVSRE